MPDDKIEAAALQKKYYGKPEELAVELARICLWKTGVVYQVFILLDNFSTLDVGCRFITKCDLYALVNKRDGLLLCKKLHHWLSGGLQSWLTPMPCVGNSFNLLILKTAIDNAKPPEEPSAEPRQLSQTEMDYYAAYANSKEVTYEKVKKIYTLGAGPRNNFNPDVCWQLPQQGLGYIVYNPDDLKSKSFLKDGYGYDQIATKETIEAAIRVAKEHNTKYPAKPLQYGDFSRPGGVNTPDHSTHNVGMAWDMRPLRRSNNVTPLAISAKTFDHPDYDREATKDFIRLVRRLYPEATFYFNDKYIYQDREFSSFVESRGGHWDHLHVMPFLKGRE